LNLGRPYGTHSYSPVHPALKRWAIITLPPRGGPYCPNLSSTIEPRSSLLRDSLILSRTPSAEALGYYHVAPTGRTLLHKSIFLR
jgi:hypothetical protein